MIIHVIASYFYFSPIQQQANSTHHSDTRAMVWKNKTQHTHVHKCARLDWLEVLQFLCAVSSFFAAAACRRLDVYRLHAIHIFSFFEFEFEMESPRHSFYNELVAIVVSLIVPHFDSHQNSSSKDSNLIWENALRFILIWCPFCCVILNELIHEHNVCADVKIDRALFVAKWHTHTCVCVSEFTELIYYTLKNKKSIGRMSKQTNEWKKKYMKWNKSWASIPNW